MPRPTTPRAVAVALALAGAALSAQAGADTIGTVDTAFKLLGRDHDIIVEAYDDPAVQGVTCYVSRARTGGIKGSLGLAEDKSEASIACRQTGPLSFAKAPLKKQEEVVDPKRNTLVYLSYSDRLIDGSPQNSVTAVPVDRGTPIPLKD